MAKKNEVTGLNDYFKKVSERARRRGFFARISAYNDAVGDFMPYYYEKARTDGIIINGVLQNPTQANIAYYNEQMGTAFRPDKGFVENALSKWLPRISFKARTNLAGALVRIFTRLKLEGKNENVIKNAYIKLMCWLYYKFERIIPNLGKDDPPKILAEGGVSYYELLLLSVLNAAGADVLIVMTGGEAAYLEADPSGEMCEYIPIDGGAFPEDFSSVEAARKKEELKIKIAAYGGKAPRESGVNAFLKGSDIFEELKTSPSERSVSEDYFFNAFVKINGAEDKITYESSLMGLEQYYKGEGRGLVIIEGQIPPPTNAEIAEIKRGNYTDPKQAIEALQKEIKAKGELKGILDGAFSYAMDTMLADPGVNAARVTTYGVCAICWLKRYFNELYANPANNISGFIFFGSKITPKEAVFLKLLSRTPVDVVIISPQLIETNFDDPKLYTVNNPYSVNLSEFPAADRGAKLGTAAYHAERDLDTLMYQNSGFYRDKQFSCADTAVLNTTYDEIPILWDEELKYRPNFAENGDSVTIPVIFAKVSGVKDGDTEKYWSDIESLITPDTIVIKKAPNIPNNAPNPLKSAAVDFIKNGKILKNRITSHKDYKYGFLRGSMQEYLLDTLQEFIDRKPIAGMFENGTEYTVIATALNMDTEILRLINKFDFTKKNPKIIYTITDEGQLSLEDTIEAAYLSAAGFDVLFFVPTGYSAVEKYFKSGAPQEHQQGEYLYDLRPPVFKAKPASKKNKPKFGFFKRK